MTIEWLAGNRLRGTTAERPSASLQSPSVGGWVELGRTTLGSANSDIDVTGLSDKRYLMMLSDFQSPSSGEIPYFRAGNGSFDSGNNYASRSSYNGASPDNYTVTSNHNAHVRGAGFGTCPHFDVCYIANLSGKEKLGQWWNVERSSAGAGTAPNRDEGVFKHAFTSNPYDQIQRSSLGGTTYASGSEVVVLGWDPSDSHTTNFWEELASVELGSAGDNLSSGTISAKKYLWVQVFTKNSGTTNAKFTFNNDTSNNYSYRYNLNGSEGTSTSQPHFQINAANGSAFYNMFIINNSANEKLVIGNTNDQNTAGAGTASDRLEWVAKWANTSAQITEIDIDNTSGGSFDTGSIIKVWGSD